MAEIRLSKLTKQFSIGSLLVEEIDETCKSDAELFCKFT